MKILKITAVKLLVKFIITKLTIFAIRISLITITITFPAIFIIDFVKILNPVIILVFFLILITFIFPILIIIASPSSFHLGVSYFFPKFTIIELLLVIATLLITLISQTHLKLLFS